MVSWTTAAPPVDIAERVARVCDTGGRTFVWSSTWTGQRRLAVGTALDLTARGTSRFEQLSTAWRRSRHGALLGGSGREPAVVGGFRFGGTDRAAAELPDALMWLPAAELVEMPGSDPQLTLNAWIDPSSDVGETISSALAAAHRLMSTESVVRDRTRPQLMSVRETPSRAGWHRLVQRALADIEAGAFSKVVLARRLSATFDRPLDVGPVLADLLNQHQTGAVFGARLGDRWFVGRTPECLVHVDGQRAETHGLAGSVPRDPDPARDASLRKSLLADPKLEREHAIVADFIVTTLREHFNDVRTTVANPVLTLADIQHLQTGISARKPSATPDLLHLAGALHPTPAVGGYPSAPALRWLNDNEPFERNWYSAPVGWADANGGELAVGIRSALIEGRSAAVYAGCGIVTGSNPEEEYQESCVKMRQMLTALGIEERTRAA